MSKEHQLKDQELYICLVIEYAKSARDFDLMRVLVPLDLVSKYISRNEILNAALLVKNSLYLTWRTSLVLVEWIRDNFVTLTPPTE